jgi:hypothetical protein
MNETCRSCGTVFHLDKSILSKKIVWLKCSVCGEKWNLSLDKTEEKDIIGKSENSSVNNEHKNDINKVEKELASIKFAVENKSKQLSESKNSILELKNKSVAEIAAELSASKLKKIQSVKEEIVDNKKNNVKKIKLWPPFFFGFLLILICLLIFRSPILGYSYMYFPSHSEKYMPIVKKFLDLIKLPILTELKDITIIDFGATLQKNEVQFFGFLENTSSHPVMLPKIKVLAVMEDGKILLEKIISMNGKVLKPYSKIQFNKIVKVDFKTENISVRATILKEIFNF